MSLLEPDKPKTNWISWFWLAIIALVLLSVIASGATMLWALWRS